MVFVSDLDRTLIYSEKFINDNAKVDKEILAVEYKDGKKLSYMTSRAMELSKRVYEEILFIPVTTRTIEQYRRIEIFSTLIRPKYAIVSNGGNILMDGKPDEEWNFAIKEQLNNEHLSYKQVKLQMENLINGNWILREYMAEDLFFYYIIDIDNIPYNKVYDFEIWLKENKWNLSIQGRKMYVMPNCVDKWKAISYILEKENLQKVIAAGDSLLDLKMLNKANYSISPSHGEIKKRIFKSAREKVLINFTESTEIYASEEIIEYVLKYIKE